MSHWYQTIRSGNPAEDQRLLSVAQAHAASQGLVLYVHPLPHGGFQVEADSPGGPSAGGYGPVPPGISAQGYGPAPAQVATFGAPSHAVTRRGCQACRRQAPTKQVSFSSNIGLIILRIPRTIRGELCRRCISKYFWQYTLTTTFLGWWGVISFFYSLVTIPMNIGTFVGARSVPDEYPR